MTNQRCSFIVEFKCEAADLVLKQNSNYIEASLSLDIGESSLRRWIDQIQKKLKTPAPQNKAMIPEQQKIQELEARIFRHTSCQQPQHPLADPCGRFKARSLMLRA
jgi:transposase